MVVCSYFLKGECRFGDRCKYEHPGPKPFSGGGGGGFGRSGNTSSNKNICHYFQKGECRYGNNCKFAHPQNTGSGQGGFGTRSSFGGQSVLRQSTFGSSSFGGGNNRNQNHNRFGALSNDAAMGGTATSFGGGQHQSSTSSILNNPTQMTQIQQIVHRDMETWETSNQWPLSCYTYLKEEPCITGLQDFSPEEIRKEAYDAKAKNTASTYEQGLKTLLERSKQRRVELKNINMHQMQSEIKSAMNSTTADSSPSTMSFDQSSQSGSLFGGSSSMGQSQSLFGGTSGMSGFGAGQNPSPFGAAQVQPVQPATSGQSIFGGSSTTGDAMPTATLFGAANANTGSSLFGATTSHPSVIKQNTFGSPLAQNQQPTPSPVQSTSTLKCSEEDLAAFKADHFVLGKIPECPPPPELCT